MEANQNNFEAWQEMAANAPESVIETLRSKSAAQTPEMQRAFIASTSKKESILNDIQASQALEDAPLRGVPYLLQDLFDVADFPTQCGAPFPEPFEHLLDGSCLLHQELKDAGAYLLAKTVPSEFGIDQRGRNKTFGECPHPNSRRFICGGGSGSSAYALKKGWAPLAFGLDSSAGIRIPAAFNGLFGFRMGNNDYARKGTFPIIPSLESVGFLTTNGKDLQTVIETFYPTAEGIEQRTPRGYRMEDPTIPLDPDLKAGMMSLTRSLDIDDSPYINKILRIAFKASNEAFSTIESRELYSIHQYWVEEYRSRYDEAVIRRIEAGQICTSEKAELANDIQLTIREAMIDFFKEYDYLAIPISSRPTPEKVEWSGQLENNLLRLNSPTSLTFLPALILPFPCGEGRFSAIQLILNPRKIHLTAAILEQVNSFYHS